jgi:AcrR family transcriptional regulator
MGHKHTKAEILAGAVETAFEHGLSQLTYGRVANHLDISDRTVVYYFASKDDLVSEVLFAIGLQLQETLAPAFTGTAADHRELARRAWPLLARTEVDPVFALFFEANGLAAAGRDPYRALVPQLIEVWVEWMAGLLTGTAQRRRAEAEATMAIIDGLLLLRQLGGPDAATRAARRLLGS